MRRTATKKGVDKSKEKERQQILMQSIAIEQSNLTALGNAKEELVSEISSLCGQRDKVLEEIGLYKVKADEGKVELEKLQAHIISGQSEVAELSSEVFGLGKKKEEITRACAVFVENATKENTAVIASLNNSVTSLEEKKVLLEREIVEKEARIAVLSKSENTISEEIANKTREKVSVDASIEHRMKELAQINLNLASSNTQAVRAKKELDDVAIKVVRMKEEITSFDKQIQEKTAEIETQEAEVDKKREQLVGLVMREKKLAEKSAAVKELFRRAGVDVNI